jgi:hypothetical protein
VTKSSNHTLSLHKLTSNSSSTSNFPWLSPTDNWLNSHSRILLYSFVCRCIPIVLTLQNSKFQFSNLLLATNWLSLYRLGMEHAKTRHVSDCVFIGPLPALGMARTTENTSFVVRMRVCWPIAQHWAWRRPHRKHFLQYPLYCCVLVFRALPTNGSTRHYMYGGRPF